MRKTVLHTFFALLVNTLVAQVNMSGGLMENNTFLCQPGVVNKSPSKGASFTYGMNPDYKMLSPEAEKPTNVRRNERFDVRLKVPLVSAPKLKVMLGLDYTLERYHFLDIVPENYPLFNHLNETELKNTGVSASFFRPLNHQFYTSMRLSANWQGDYGSFVSLDSRYAVYRLTAVFGVKKRENLEYGAGILLNKGYRGSSIVPFGFYNHTFNNHWGVEAVLPSSLKMRYNIKDGQIAMFGTELTSQNYALMVKEPVQLEGAPFHFRRASLDVVGIFYQRLTNWTWVQFKAGYAFDNDSDARNLPRRLTHDLKPSGSAIGVISLFLSPPKKCLDRANAQLPAGS